MKTALRQAAEVNNYLRRMGENAWGHRADITIILFRFNEIMAEENARIEQTDEYGNFLYISFQVILKYNTKYKYLKILPSWVLRQWIRLRKFTLKSRLMGLCPITRLIWTSGQLTDTSTG